MSALLRGLEGVVCHIDDILVYRKNQQEHDEHLEAVLKRLADAELTLNFSQVPVFSKESPLSGTCH